MEQHTSNMKLLSLGQNELLSGIATHDFSYSKVLTPGETAHLYNADSAIHYSAGGAAADPAIFFAANF